MKIIELADTCDASGDLTITGTNKVTGFIEKIEMDYDDGDNLADSVFTIEGVTSQALLTKANLGTSDTVFYPRHTGNLASDGSAFTNWGTKFFLNNETVKVVIANGGVSKNFKFLVHVSDGDI